MLKNKATEIIIIVYGIVVAFGIDYLLSEWITQIQKVQLLAI